MKTMGFAGGHLLRKTEKYTLSEHWRYSNRFSSYLSRILKL